MADTLSADAVRRAVSFLLWSMLSASRVVSQTVSMNCGARDAGRRQPYRRRPLRAIWHRDGSVLSRERPAVAWARRHARPAAARARRRYRRYAIALRAPAPRQRPVNGGEAGP